MTQQTHTPLLPCPFCGGEAKLWEGDWANNDHGVICTKCEIAVDPCKTDYIETETSEQYAARAWNTRLFYEREELIRKLKYALGRQCENMAFILNRVEIGTFNQWGDKFKKELMEDCGVYNNVLS